MSRIFGAADQNGYVVPDLRSAIDQWVEAGVGPWFVYPHLPISSFVHRGRASRPDISIALSNAGPLQIELIQQHDRSASLYLEFLETCPQGGLQHLGFFRSDYDEACRAATDAGFVVGHAGEIMGGRFAYHVPAAPASGPRHLGAVMELAEVDAERRRGFDVIAAVAAAWDGRDRPVRVQPT